MIITQSDVKWMIITQSDVKWMIITQSDVNRKARIFDRKIGKGLIGIITQIDGNSFRFQTDSGREYLFSIEGELAVQVQFLGDA